MSARKIRPSFFKTRAAMAMVLLVAASAGLRAEPFFSQQDLFISGHDDVNIYRIPSLIVSPKGTILAFCEARQGDDGDPTDLVLKRSLHGGQPSQPRNLNGYPRTFGYGVNWQRMQVVLAGKGEAIMQPCPVVDRTTGEILICCQEIRGGLANLLKNEWHGRCLILRSVDDGETWSPPCEITESVGHFAAGPGIGIQLRSGRLVIPGYSKEGSRVIFSDDHGQMWRAGAPVNNKGCNESQVVELTDGSLLMNMRQGGRRRYVAFSTDQGETWFKSAYSPTGNSEVPKKRAAVIGAAGSAPLTNGREIARVSVTGSSILAQRKNGPYGLDFWSSIASAFRSPSFSIASALASPWSSITSASSLASSLASLPASTAASPLCLTSSAWRSASSRTVSA